MLSLIVKMQTDVSGSWGDGRVISKKYKNSISAEIVQKGGNVKGLLTIGNEGGDITLGFKGKAINNIVYADFTLKTAPFCQGQIKVNWQKQETYWKITTNQAVFPKRFTLRYESDITSFGYN